MGHPYGKKLLRTGIKGGYQFSLKNRFRQLMVIIDYPEIRYIRRGGIWTEQVRQMSRKRGKGRTEQGKGVNGEGEWVKMIEQGKRRREEGKGVNAAGVTSMRHLAILPPGWQVRR
jgi:hypothetical protein